MLRNTAGISMAVLVTQLAWICPQVTANDVPVDVDSATEAESGAYAGKRLHDMATWLVSQQEYTVTMRAGYDVLQESGQKVEFGELREISVKRPDRVRIEQTASDGRRDLILFDGEHLTVLDATVNVFAQAPTPGEDLDDAIRYLLDSLGLRLPLAPLLMAGFPEILRRHVIEVDLVETTDLLGPSADHIAVRAEQVDFQVWVTRGEQPWPLRVVISYRMLPGSPQFWANLYGWNRSPEFNQQTFVFKQPAGATRIPFAAQFLTEPTLEDVDAAAGQGGKS